MIFAKVDVELLTHPRVLRIAKAMRAECIGVWTLALLYSRRHELDGFCPLEAIDQIARDKAVDQLVTVGLIAREEQDGMHGVRILRYADRNETREEIAERRKDTLKRVTKHREKRVTPIARNALHTSVTDAFVPDSDSGSDSDSVLGSPGLRINPPAQSFQDSKGEPSSGVQRVADVLRTPDEIEQRRAKAIEDAERLKADPSFAAGRKR